MGISKIALLGLATSALMIGGAQAADLMIPETPMMPTSAATSWDGLYIGVQGGALWAGTVFPSLGGVVGANFTVTDGVLAGVEFQANGYLGAGFEVLALGRLGVMVADNVLLYADAGVGMFGGPVYAFGGGIEFAAMDNFTIRGDVQAEGGFGAPPFGVRTTVGLFYHFN